MSSVFFHVQRSLALMALLTQDRLEQIYQAVEKQYARHKRKLIVYFYD